MSMYKKTRKKFVISLFCLFSLSTLFYWKTFKTLLVNQIELENEISLLAFGNIVGANYILSFVSKGQRNLTAFAEKSFEKFHANVHTFLVLFL